MLLWTLMLSLARAESAGVIPAGAGVLYSGAGVTTFNQMTQDGAVITRDREVRLRGDVYGALGLARRLQLSASVPVVASFMVDDSSRLPCPGLLQDEGYCETYVTAGQGRVDLRYQVLQRGANTTLGIAADVDNWNANRRGQFNSAGSGRTMLEALAVVGGPLADSGAWTLDGLMLGGFGYFLAPDVTSADGSTTVKAPGDTVRASVELRAHRQGLAVEVGGHVVQRLSGVDLDSEWIDEWFPSSLDRWNVLHYRGISASGKVSLDLPNNSGVHIGVYRVVAVDNGASNTTDLTVGWHRYFAPRQ